MKYRVLKKFLDENNISHDVGEVLTDCEPYGSELNGFLLINAFIKEIKDEPWKPGEGDEYEYLTDTGKPSATYWNNTGIDKYRYALGNCFKRQIGRQVSDETLHASEWLKVFKVLRDDTKGFKPDWKDMSAKKWSVHYGFGDNELKIYWSLYDHSHIIYFATKADAEESIKKHEQEWKVFLGIEEEG